MRVAVIGAGAMAREHIRAFRDIPGVEVAGVHSRTRARAETVAREFGIRVVGDSIDALYAETQAELVVVAVSVAQTSPVCHAVFAHPWTSLIEKPAGLNVAEAEELLSVARQRGRRACVALNRRHLSSTQSVVAGLAESSDTRLIHVQDQEDLVAARRAGHPEDVVDNWMYANAIHCVDLLRVFGRGEVLAVERIVPWQREEPQFVVANVRFSSGDVGLYQAVWNGPGPWAVTVTTQATRWEMRPIEQAALQRAGSRVLEPVETADWDRQFKPGFRHQAQEAVRAARGEAHGLCSLEDALVTMRLVESIYA